MVECRGCGRDVVPGLTQEGQVVILDPRLLVYTVIPGSAGVTAMARRNKGAMAIHTCERRLGGRA